MTDFFGSLVSGATKLLGGFLSDRSSASAQRQNAAAQWYANQMNANQAEAERIRQDKWAQRNIDLQYEFAKNGLQWKVADAKAAGVHPLAALGSSGYSASPVTVGSSTYDYTPYTGRTGGSGVGSAMADMGQDISRAIQATRSEDERTKAYESTVQALTVKRMSLENDLLASKIAMLGPRSAQIGPAMPTSTRTTKSIEGQGDSNSITIRGGRAIPDDQAAERTVTDADNPNTAGQGYPSGEWMRVDGAYVPTMSKDASDRNLDEDIYAKTIYNLRNRVMPNFGVNWAPPPNSLLPDWANEWAWSPGKQGYVPVSRGRTSDDGVINRNEYFSPRPRVYDRGYGHPR